jgi:hypothetical protein
LPAITVHLNGLPADLAPVRSAPLREWWSDDSRTNGHARHCQPLVLANSLGYEIRSPGTFHVSWSGDWEDDATVTVETGEEIVVDNHSARGSFTLQPGFIPATDRPGDFILVKSVPNVRDRWFTVMEALVEAWWQPGEFGLVCLLHRPGTFTVRRGESIAQMAVYRAEGGFASLRVSDDLPAETPAWRARRSRTGYRKDLDYLHGRHPDGTVEPTHVRSWRRRPAFLEPA